VRRRKLLAHNGLRHARPCFFGRARTAKHARTDSLQRRCPSLKNRRKLLWCLDLRSIRRDVPKPLLRHESAPGRAHRCRAASEARMRPGTGTGNRGAGGHPSSARVPLLACPAVPQGRSNNTAGRASSATRPRNGTEAVPYNFPGKNPRFAIRLKCYSIFNFHLGVTGVPRLIWGSQEGLASRFA